MLVPSIWAAYGEAFWRLIYPAYCGVCRRMLELEEKGICRSCLVRLQAIRFSMDQAIVEEKFRALDEAWALYPYESPFKEIILGIKFLKKRWLVRIFSEEIRPLIQAIVAENDYDYLVPIPLDRKKLLEREFNQAELLAGLIHTLSGTPIAARVLGKRSGRIPQSQLKRRERLRNPSHAFWVRRRFNVRNKRLLLIDDVLTTGATAEEAARMLKRNGAKKVGLVALARTFPGAER